MKKIKGVALVQILLFSTILILLASFVTNKVNAQLKIAQSLIDRQSALLKSDSAFAAVKFHLLTSRPDQLINQLQWNFYEKPFDFEGVQVSIQAHNGLLNVTDLADDKTFKTVYNQLSIESDFERMRNFFNKLSLNRQSWHLQNVEQLISMGIDEKGSLDIWRILSLNLKQSFNPMAIPNELIPVFFDKSSSEEILNARKAKNSFDEEKSIYQFAKEHSVKHEFEYIIGPYYRVKLHSEVGASVWSMLYELKVELGLNGLDLVLISQRPQ